jgi:hypothetical protein
LGKAEICRETVRNGVSKEHFSTLYHPSVACMLRNAALLAVTALPWADKGFADSIQVTY